MERSFLFDGTIYALLPLVLFYVFVIYRLFVYSPFEEYLADTFLFSGFDEPFLAPAAIIGGTLQFCYHFAFDADGLAVWYLVQQIGDAECEPFLFVRHEVRAGVFARGYKVRINGTDGGISGRNIGCYHISQAFGSFFALLVEAMEESKRHLVVVEVGTHDYVL